MFDIDDSEEVELGSLLVTIHDVLRLGFPVIQFRLNQGHRGRVEFRHHAELIVNG